MNISAFLLQIRMPNIMRKKPLSIMEWLNVWKPGLLIEGIEETGRPDIDSLDLITECHRRKKDGCRLL